MVFNLDTSDSFGSSSFSTSEAALPARQSFNCPDGCLRALVSRPVVTGSKGRTSRLTIFKYEEILKITKKFAVAIGEGAFGKVYRGQLKEEAIVAVKVLYDSTWQGRKEFLNETRLLSSVHHRNLVSLIGYCDGSKNKALVYEFMANGNLRQHLSGDCPNILTWDERLRIAIDVAQGLDYLHNGCSPAIIHADIKTTNILLNEYMRAKISDFGMSRDLAATNSINESASSWGTLAYLETPAHAYKSTSPLGTPGYLPPEYGLSTYDLIKKGDVYSFGIVLLELISGLSAINTSEDGKSVYIREWAVPKFQSGYIHRLIDPKVEEKFEINSAEIVAKVAESCTQTEPGARPDINRVLIELNRAELASKHKYEDGNQEEHIGATSLEVESDSAPLVRAVHSIH